MRRGLTLVELLIVCFILLLFVAIAAPLLRPQSEGTKIREATRQINSYFAEAKTIAAQTGRPCGVRLDRAAALREGARDSNIVTRLQLTESPPPYSGDVTDAQVGVWLDPVQAPIPGFTQAPIPQGGTFRAARIVSLDFDFTGGQNAMLGVIMQSYFSNPPVAGELIPFTIRFLGRGRRHPGVAYATGTPGMPPGIAGRTIQYICLSEFGDSLYNVPLPVRGMAPPELRTFEVICSPVITTDSPLELPTGTAIDLQWSGFGQTGSQFFDATRASTRPLNFMFDASGRLTQIQRDQLLENPIGRLHLMIGTDKRAIDTVDSTTPANRPLPGSNIDNAEGFWVSVSTQTGNVTSSENLVPINPPDVPTAIQQARGLTTGLQTTGGR